MKQNEHFVSLECTYDPITTPYAAIRIDGKNFRGLLGPNKPFDESFHQSMVSVCIDICPDVQNCVLGYVQSDEINIVMALRDPERSQHWLGGKPVKMASVSASMATLYFYKHTGMEAFFDSRVILLADENDAINYIIWRRKDARRNAILKAARCKFSHKQIQGKHTGELLKMLGEEIEGRQCWGDFVIKTALPPSVLNVVGREPIIVQRSEWKNKVADYLPFEEIKGYVDTKRVEMVS